MQAQSADKVQQAVSQVERQKKAQGETPRLQDLDVAFRVTQFTGSIVVHYRGGRPLRVEMGRPKVIDLE
jgi:hypothetical protein